MEWTLAAPAVAGSEAVVREARAASVALATLGGVPALLVERREGSEAPRAAEGLALTPAVAPALEAAVGERREETLGADLGVRELLEEAGVRAREARPEDSELLRQEDLAQLTRAVSTLAAAELLEEPVPEDGVLERELLEAQQAAGVLLPRRAAADGVRPLRGLALEAGGLAPARAVREEALTLAELVQEERERREEEEEGGILEEVAPGEGQVLEVAGILAAAQVLVAVLAVLEAGSILAVPRQWADGALARPRQEWVVRIRCKAFGLTTMLCKREPEVAIWTLNK